MMQRSRYKRTNPGAGSLSLANPQSNTVHRKSKRTVQRLYCRLADEPHLAAILIIVSVTLLLASINNSNKNIQYNQQLRSSAGNSSSSLCEIKVCSHQVLNAFGSPDGSLQAMSALWKAGISCFDIDIVTLKDGTLLTAHPRRFATAVGAGAKAPQEYTLEEARIAGVDEIRFPLLEDILVNFGTLVRAQSNDYDESETLVFRHGGPLLNLDLKGPNLTLDHVDKLRKVVAEQGISRNVAVCATELDVNDTGPGVDLLTILGSKQSNDLRVGLVLRDRVAEDNDLARVLKLVAHYRGVELIVPSSQFDVEYFQYLQTHVHKPITAWTVDDEEGLAHAIESGLDAVISNHPIELSSKLQAMKEGHCTI